MILRLLSWLERPEPSILARVIGGPFLPGDQVDVELIWSGGPGGIGWEGDGPKEVFLDLVCRETFWYTVKSTGAAFIGNYPGHGEENHTGLPYTAAGRPGRYKTSRDLECLSNYVTPINQSLDGANPQGIARFQLPASAPPSINGDTARVEWELRVRPASTLSRESTTVGKITVLSSLVDSIADQTSPHDSGDRSAAPREFNVAQCNVSLSLPEGPVRAGQTLNGVLKAKAQSDIHITKVQAELECLEQAGAKQSAAVYSKAELQGRSLLHAGKKYQWPFQLQIPDRLLPSAVLDETSVVWRVKGILGRTFRTRLETATQVQVLSTGQESQS